MIRFSREGTKLYAGISTTPVVSVSKDEEEKQPILWFAHELGGNPLAAAALEAAIKSAFGYRLEVIRRQAYQQGAKDRANRATQFASDIGTGFHRGGCLE